MDSVLVLDGCQRSALAVVRSLGGHGLRMHAGDVGRDSLAGRSRHAAGHIELPPPERADEYAEAVIEACRRHAVEWVFPVTDASMTLLVCRPANPAGPRIASPPAEAYESMSDKSRLIELAGRLGVRVPRTRVARNTGELTAAAGEFGYPLVLKPARSKLRVGDRLVATSVAVIANAAALEASAALRWLEFMPLLVQEYIPGHGAGLFALYGHHGPVAWFAHRRLREKPPAGGISVLSESVAVDPLLREYAERLLSAVCWFGPAMIEFRIEAEGRPWLMEVNGRFWGSLQLAIDCGVDFPWLWYRLCRGEEVRGPEQYQLGRRLRWLMGDLDHLLLQLRGKGTASSFGERLAAVGRFMNFFDARTHFEVLRRDDPAPFRHELRHWLGSLGGR